MNQEKVRLLREKIEQLDLTMSWRMKEEVSCCGITLAQGQILTELGRRKEICIAELAQMFGLDSSTLSRTVNRMVEADIVDRIVNASDRRYVSLTLTEKGRELYSYIESKCHCYYSEVMQMIPEDKRDQVIESIVLLADAIKTYKEQQE